VILHAGWAGTKPEARMPKSERNPKTEVRNDRTGDLSFAIQGLKSGLLSEFGFRVSDLKP
jgi:hypothetical protein